MFNVLRYATSSKLVNVKKLKHDIWHKLEHSLPNLPPDDAASESDASPQDTTKEELSFQDLVSTVADEQTQKDVSISFYFICLLHLANEKVV